MGDEYPRMSMGKFKDKASGKELCVEFHFVDGDKEEPYGGATVCRHHALRRQSFIGRRLNATVSSTSIGCAE